jgi:hypothetical protein
MYRLDWKRGGEELKRKKEKFKKEILKNLDFEFGRLYLINKIVEKNG